MKKILKKWWMRLLMIPGVIFLVLVFSYALYSKTLPVSFWDEFFWVGRSYFFEYYINGDFKNEIWQSYESFDQPKLAEYSYGAWLYPTYLKEKKNEKSLSYTNFLKENGFSKVDDGAYISLEDYLIKNNINKLKPISLVYKARWLDVFLLAGAVILIYFLVLQNANIIIATIFSLFYGFNSLLINTGLMAHSEALFLFTFNAAFLFMSLYFIKKGKNIYLILFSILAGLCMSTKLNGLILIIIFFILNIILFLILKKNKITDVFLKNILSLLICLFVFLILNPFVYPHPLENTFYLFDWRMKIATITQTNLFREVSLPNAGSRIIKIFENFYFSRQTPNFNGIKINTIVPIGYGICLFALFILGVIYSVKMALNKNIAAIIVCISFIIILLSMTFYLVLDWPRYYVQLVLFFGIFQMLGLISIIQKHFFLNLT